MNNKSISEAGAVLTRTAVVITKDITGETVGARPLDKDETARVIEALTSAGLLASAPLSGRNEGLEEAIEKEVRSYLNEYDATNVMKRISRHLRNLKLSPATGGRDAVLECALRWCRARHHGTKDEIEIQEECLADAVAALRSEQPADKQKPGGGG